MKIGKNMVLGCSCGRQLYTRLSGEYFLMVQISVSNSKYPEYSGKDVNP
jgi:hypothetical protein